MAGKSCCFRIWDAPSVHYFVVFIIALVCMTVLFTTSDNLAAIPTIFQMLPLSSFMLCALDKADAAYLHINLAIAALSLIALARVALAPARANRKDSIHATVA